MSRRRLLRRLRLPLLLVVLCIVSAASLFAWMILRHQESLAMFGIAEDPIDLNDPVTRAMAALGTPSAWTYVPPDAPASFLGFTCAAVEVDVGGGFRMFISKPPPGSQPGLQLQIARVMRDEAGMQELSLGQPRLLCDLDEAQARRVLEDGVPGSLIDAMLTRTTAVDWGGTTPAAAAHIRVDPAGHFP